MTEVPVLFLQMAHSLTHLLPSELDVIRPIAEDFFAEARYSGHLAFDTFKRFWQPMLGQGFGEIVVAKQAGNDKVVGLVGAIFSPSIFNGEPTAMFHFWYARPEVRGRKVGVDLFERIEQEAKLRDCSAILAGHILTINEDGYRRFFERKGYTLREFIYRKELK